MAGEKLLHYVVVPSLLRQRVLQVLRAGLSPALHGALHCLCIRSMKKTHTAISSNMGNHATNPTKFAKACRTPRIVLAGANLTASDDPLMTPNVCAHHTERAEKKDVGL